MQVIKMNQEDILNYPTNIINKKNLFEMLIYLFIRIESQNESMRKLALYLKANAISKEVLYEQIKNYSYEVSGFIMELANECFYIGLNIEALYFFNKIYETYNDNTDLNYKIAYCLYNLKAYDKALEILYHHNCYNDEINILINRILEAKNERE